MKSKVRLLNLIVSFTLILLTIGATLVVLGIFNQALRWDIFGPRLEALLYGVFGSCMALAGFGVVMTGSPVSTSQRILRRQCVRPLMGVRWICSRSTNVMNSPGTNF